jgi:16S rRNA (guanine527-N7)-methyltransferase
VKPLEPEIESELRAFGQLLATEGITRGLIGPREGERIWERHILNCLPVTTLLPEGASVADIGSGAGLPGIVIAIARPDLKVTLIEPLQRRVDFLIEATAKLPNVKVIRGKSENVKGQRFDFVTARAVAPLPKLIAISKHLAPTLLALKGESAKEEMLGIKGAKLHEISVEGQPMARIVEVSV